MSSESVRTTGEATTERSGCPECGGRIDIHADEPHCVECGLVGEQTDRLHRWPRRGDDVDPVNTLRHDRGIGNTKISYRDRNGECHDGFRTNRMRMWQHRVQAGTKKERHLKYVLREVNRIAAGLGIDRSTQDLAGRLLRSACEAGLFRGRDLDGFSAAAVLIACRVQGSPYGRDAVRPLARNPESIKNAYDTMQRELEIPVPPAQPSTFIPRIIAQVDAPDAVMRRARELAECLDGTAAISGRMPQAVAATCVYQAALDVANWDRAVPWRPCGIKLEELTEAAGCCEATIRQTADIVEGVAGDE